MSISPYFQHVTASNEQKLIDDLTRETIYQRGLNLYYIPRTEAEQGFDYLFGENPENIYDNAVELEFYCLNVSTGFEGEAAIGRFALEIANTATFLTSVTRFREEVQKEYPNIKRPREGDLILFKTDPTEAVFMFEITYVEDDTPFYQIGKSNVFRMEAEKFNYSHETLNTGIDDIDTRDLSTENEEDESPDIQTESDSFVDFNETDPFSESDY